MVLPLPFLLLSLSHIPQTSPSQKSTHGLAPVQSHLPAVGPILQNRPFIVVWNMPTAQCQTHHNIQLNLEDFDIIANGRQRFQGQKMTIFYRDHLGKYPYVSRDGLMLNGGIPQLGDLSAHLSLAANQMSCMLQPNFSGLAVIDWEEWRPLWERNFGTKKKYRRLSKLLVRSEKPNLSDRAITSLAKQMFEVGARRFMEKTLRLAVRQHPKGLWGFYGFPVCSNKRKGERGESYTGRCQRGTKKHNDQLSWLWSGTTALYPSIYLPRSLAGSPDAALMVRHRLLEALRVASVWRNGNPANQATPVLPYARIAFTHTLTFLNKTDLLHTLAETAALGAAGVVLWGELKFGQSKHQCILLRDYISSVLGPLVRSLQADTHLCSFQLCHGKGRCVRRHPHSGYLISSAVAMTSDRKETVVTSMDFPNGKGIHTHFMCRCYPGWTGRQCRTRSE